MRLIVMGQQAFGKDVLAKLLDAGQDEVVGVYCEPDKDGKPADPIKEFALEKGLTVEQPANFDDAATLERLASFKADLMVMAFVNVFVPEAARDTPTHGSICFHPSLLPLYRGPSAVNWPIIMGDTKSGYSWFYPSDGLDEGDSLLQWECEIGPDDTVIDLYFKKIYPHAVDSVLTVVDLYRSGNPPRIVADESKASYERRCTTKHSKIDWNKPVKQVYDLIAKLDVFDSARAPGDGISSRVRAISEAGIEVQCVGGRVLVKRVRPEGGAKISAIDWAKSVDLKVGDELGE